MTIKKIFLDFYNNNLICFNAKEYDSQSRNVNITCTDHGKKVFIDESRMSALIAFKREDGYEDLVDGIIQEDGTILLDLTKDMLEKCGKLELDVIIIAQNAISTDDFLTAQALKEINSSVISTMKFYINVISSSISYDEVETSDDYKYLVRALMKLNSLETELSGLKKDVINLMGDEEDTSYDDTMYGVKKAAEEAAADAKDAADGAREAIRDVEEAIDSAEAATEDAKTAVNNVAIAIENVEKTIDDAETATNNANEAAEVCRDVIDDASSVFINVSEKGTNNGVATLDEGGKVPSQQLPLTTDLKITEEGYALDASIGNELNIAIETLEQTKQDVIAEAKYLEGLDVNVGDAIKALSNKDELIDKQLGELDKNIETLNTTLEGKEDKFDVLPVEKGGTGSSSREGAVANILGYVPSLLVGKQTDDITTTDYNYFRPFNSLGQEEEIIARNGNLSIANYSVKIGDRSISTDGVLIGANIHIVRVTVIVRYKNNSDDGCSLHTYLEKTFDPTDSSLAGGKIGAASGYIHGKSSSSTRYLTQTISTITTVSEGDFLYAYSYKGSKNNDIDITAGNEFENCQFIVEAIG